MFNWTCTNSKNSFFKCCCFYKNEPPKLLFVFDFDCTIVAKNSEQIYKTVVAKKKGLSEQELDQQPLPPAPIKWDHMCQGLVNYVFGDECGVSLEELLDGVKGLPMVPGMELLLGNLTTHVLSTNHNADLIVLSGSNDLFISTKLAALHPPIYPNEIISNHATIIVGVESDSGTQQQQQQQQQQKRLVNTGTKLFGLKDKKPSSAPRHKVPPSDLTPSAAANTALGFIYTPHSAQTSCSMCNKALCKGHELEAYFESHGRFHSIHFFCDGTNDVCPALRLRDQDFVYIRMGYGFEGLLLGAKKAPGPAGIPIVITAKIIYWVNGMDLWDKLMENLDLSYIEDD